MSSPKGTLSWLDLLLRLFRPRSQATPPPPPSPMPAPEPTPAPAQIVNRRVLLISYNPIVDESRGVQLLEYMNWRKPQALATDFILDILRASYGLARFEIVENVERKEFPVLIDGFRYTPARYLDVLRKIQPPHTPPMADYSIILKENRILERVASGEIDEVWIFAFPHGGFYESTMGGAGAFWCNGPVLPDTESCPRRFVVMGFSCERGVGEMLEAFGHRAEFILEKTFSRLPPSENLYQRFTLYDKIAPGQAHVGTIHFAPNSETDYDWGNPRFVRSACDDWYNFPNFRNLWREVNATEWGNGDIRAHHLWWFKHLPHVGGFTNGIANNWWEYIMDPNRVNV